LAGVSSVNETATHSGTDYRRDRDGLMAQGKLGRVRPPSFAFD